jgi:hypothetical protein
MKANFEIYPIGTKVQSTDKNGYYVMNACGFIAKHLGNGHSIIKTFDGKFYSTVSQSRIFDVEVIN